MKRRKIGSITPIWNHKMFIGPHFDMLSVLDRNVVLIQSGPLQSYISHGVGVEKDNSEKIIRKKFPNVEILESNYDYKKDFSGEIYNEGLKIMGDCNIVLRFDPDMFFTEKDWNLLLEFIDSTNFDSYYMDFRNDSINYNMSWDYEHGLKTALEINPMAVNPKFLFGKLLEYPQENSITIKIPGWICHHLRGWNKPESVSSNWHLSKKNSELVKRYGDENGEWFKLPVEIKNKLEEWRVELKKMGEEL